MPDVALHERSPLHGLAVPGRHGAAAGAPGLVVEERVSLAFATVIARRGKADALATAVAASYGVTLPRGPRRASSGGVTFAGVGPDQWIASAEGADASFVTKMRSRIGPLAAVMDQTDARAVIRLSGPKAREVLAKGVPTDLHPTVFKAGDVATTLVAYIGVQLDLLDDGPTYQLTAPRSMAGSFWSWLAASAAEFGYEVLPPR